AVKRNARSLDGIARVERRHSTHVTALRAALGGSPPDYVIDFIGLDVVAFGKRGENRACKMLRMKMGERALAHLANAARGAACVDDICVRHSVFSLLSCSWGCDFSSVP